MTNLREQGRAPEPFRTRPNEPDPMRAFTGWVNGKTDPGRYRAHLLRFTWDEHWEEWVWPDTCWSPTLCDYDAYPRRWHGGADLIFNPASELYVAEVAEMKLCMSCEEVWDAYENRAAPPQQHTEQLRAQEGHMNMITAQEHHKIAIRSTAVTLAVELVKSGQLQPTQTISEMASKIAAYIEHGTVTEHTSQEG